MAKPVPLTLSLIGKSLSTITYSITFNHFYISSPYLPPNQKKLQYINPKHRKIRIVDPHPAPVFLCFHRNGPPRQGNAMDAKVCRANVVAFGGQNACGPWPNKRCGNGSPGPGGGCCNTRRSSDAYKMSNFDLWRLWIPKNERIFRSWNMLLQMIVRVYTCIHL